MRNLVPPPAPPSAPHGYLTPPFPNTHRYQEAKIAAAASKIGDISGHLVAPSSTAESEFLQERFGEAVGLYWLGAQLSGSDWFWTDGLTGGITFWSGGIDGGAPDGQEANWAAGEPKAPSLCAVSDGGAQASWATRGCASKAKVLVEYDLRDFVEFRGSTFEILDSATFAEALVVAAGRSYNGQSGRLVTIESLSKNAALYEAFGTGSFWAGASDNTTEGEWKWVTGPREGQVFWNGNQEGSSVPQMFSNWHPGEPNNVGGKNL